jgi:hypothetical protein
MAMIGPIFPSTFHRICGIALGREALQLCTMGAQNLKCANWLHELTLGRAINYHLSRS